MFVSWLSQLTNSSMSLYFGRVMHFSMAVFNSSESTETDAEDSEESDEGKQSADGISLERRSLEGGKGE